MTGVVSYDDYLPNGSAMLIRMPSTALMHQTLFNMSSFVP